MKKVLIITYHFPPDAAVGGIRPAKFAKYLPEFGWEPVVYTVKERYYESCDYSRFEPALKSLKIYRANLIPGPLHLYSRLIHKTNSSINNTSEITEYLEEASQYRGNSLKRFLSCMARVPDDKPGWIFNILMGGCRIIKKHKIDAIITSGPPMGTHLGGLLLKHLTHVKWIADFRDPWKSAAWTSQYYLSSNFANYIDKWLESRVILGADILVATSPRLNNYFQSIVPLSQKNKCRLITNGFDESDFLRLGKSTCTASSRIKITYAGSFCLNHNPEPLFIAMQELIRRREINKESVEIDLIGNCAYWRGVSVQSLIGKYGHNSMIRMGGKIPFRECLGRLMESNALLLFAQGHPLQLPSKAFEYLRLNKPIFVLTGEGDTKDLLRGFENVFIANPDNIDDIGEKFLQMLRAINNNELLLSSREKIDKYDRRNLTGELALCLEQLSNKY